MGIRPNEGPVRTLFGLDLADLALAVMLGGFGLVEVWITNSYRGTQAANTVLVLWMALTLAWRRRAPLTVLVVVVGIVAIQSIVFGASETGSLLLMALVAVYSAAAHSSRPRVAAGVAFAGAIVHDLFDPAIDSLAAHLYSPIAFGLVLVFGFAMRHRQSRAAIAEARVAALEEAHERTRHAAAEERRRIAHELHDIVAHSLGVMVLQAGVAERVLDTNPGGARESLQSIRQTGREAVDEMARLLGLIRDEQPPSLEPQPSLADLTHLIDKARSSGLQIEFSISGAPQPLSAALELSAFRIVQEALTNILKHAKSERAHVLIHYRERELELEVSNDGKAETDLHGGGYGLVGLRERVAVFGGNFEAGPDLSGGWMLRAVLPFER